MVENIGRWGNGFNVSEKGREAKLSDRQVRVSERAYTPIACHQVVCHL